MKKAVKAVPGRLVLVMGVAGCGKSALAKKLAQDRDSIYVEADDFHPEENIRKMGRGLPLDDEDRRPWLEAIVEEVQSRLGQAGVDEVILACSALRQWYRDMLMSAAQDGIILYLKISLPEARKRVAERRDHFFPVVLVQDQFMALEEPDNAVLIDAGLPVDTQQRQAAAYLEEPRPAR